MRPQIVRNTWQIAKPRHKKLAVQQTLHLRLGKKVQRGFKAVLVQGAQLDSAEIPGQ